MAAKVDLTERERCERRETQFWAMFQATYRGGCSEFNGRALPVKRDWGFSIRPGLKHFVVFNREGARAELYIDSPDQSWNKLFFDWLRESRPVVDRRRFGDLVWQRLDHRCSSRVSLVNARLSFETSEDWNEAVRWLCEALDELRRAIPVKMLDEGIAVVSRMGDK